jgi:hypothetical protein
LEAYHVFQSLRPIDCSEGSEDSEDSKNFHNGYGVRFEDEGDERHSDDQYIQKVEGATAKGALMEDESVHNHLERDLDGEY